MTPGEPVSTATRRRDAVLAALTLALAGAAAAVVQARGPQVTFEELSEAVRHVFWLDEGFVRSGIGSNVGWYALLLAAYRVLGFSLRTAVWVKLGMLCVSLACLAWCLRRWMPPAAAAAVLVAYGLSPTLLNFTRVGASYACDLLLAPPCLALAVWTSGRTWRLLVMGAAVGASALCYPPCVFVIPPLALLLAWQQPRPSARGWAAWGLGLVLPLLVALLWLQNPSVFLRDEVTGAGVFRGSGVGLADPSRWRRNGLVLARDLLVSGSSYYFYGGVPDFGGPLGWLACGAAAIGAGALWWWPSGRRLLLVAGMVAAPSLGAAVLTAGNPGIRRGTGLLLAAYTVYGGVLACLLRQPRRPLRAAGFALCLLVPLHHALAYPGLLRPDPFRQHAPRGWWVAAETSEAALQYWLARTEKGDALDCREIGDAIRCDYSTIFAALAGHRRWNGEAERPLRAWSPGAKAYVTLSVPYFQASRPRPRRPVQPS
jgi:hypothetical protein